METIFGAQIGAELFAKKKWLALSTEVIVWKAVPSLLTLNLFQWGMRTFGDRDLSTSLTLFRIQFMWLDWEIYFVGGINDENDSSAGRG